MRRTWCRTARNVAWRGGSSGPAWLQTTRLPFVPLSWLCLLPQLQGRLPRGCPTQGSGFRRAWRGPQAPAAPPLLVPQVQAVYLAGAGGAESQGADHGEMSPLNRHGAPSPRQGQGGGSGEQPPPISLDKPLGSAPPHLQQSLLMSEAETGGGVVCRLPPLGGVRLVALHRPAAHPARWPTLPCATLGLCPHCLASGSPCHAASGPLWHLNTGGLARPGRGGAQIP